MKYKKPKMIDNKLYALLREGRVSEFNEARIAGEQVDLKETDLSRLDLRGLRTKGLDFSGCYFRQADLRGIDFYECDMEGASIHGAHISGTYFPRGLSSNEIRLSLEHGTRMRYKAGH